MSAARNPKTAQKAGEKVVNASYAVSAIDYARHRPRPPAARSNSLLSFMAVMET